MNNIVEFTKQLTESFTKHNASNATCVSVLFGMEEGIEGLVVSATFTVPFKIIQHGCRMDLLPCSP